MNPPDARQLVDSLLKDPPKAHEGLEYYESMAGKVDEGVLPPGSFPDEGVWRTERDLYEFVASKVERGSRTLETGLGVSTALFTTVGCDHICVTASQVEVDRLFDYLDNRGIGRVNLDVRVGYSDDILPQLTTDPVDLFFIDGAHGFPTPALDWYFGARHLKRQGMLVIDDIQLPQVQSLDAFLTKDRRWIEMDRTEKWVAYRRESEGSLREEWFSQPEFSAPELLVDKLREAAATAGRDVKVLGRRVRDRINCLRHY